jgi:hypothetical protein
MDEVGIILSCSKPKGERKQIDKEVNKVDEKVMEKCMTK